MIFSFSFTEKKNWRMTLQTKVWISLCDIILTSENLALYLKLNRGPEFK